MMLDVASFDTARLLVSIGFTCTTTKLFLYPTMFYIKNVAISGNKNGGYFLYFNPKFLHNDSAYYKY